MQFLQGKNYRGQQSRMNTNINSIRIFKTEEKNMNENKILLSEVKPGETFNTEIGTFIVLEQTDEGTRVITKDLFEQDQQFGQSPDYKGSYMQQLCEGKIYDAFAKVFGPENIIEHEVDLVTVDMQQDYGKANCRVRPLTFDEVRKYNDMLVNEELEDWYWTCTPWSVPGRGWSYTVAVVSSSGYFNDDYYYYDDGVRPFCILKSNIFVSKGE